MEKIRWLIALSLIIIKFNLLGADEVFPYGLWPPDWVPHPVAPGDHPKDNNGPKTA